MSFSTTTAGWRCPACHTNSFFEDSGFRFHNCGYGTFLMNPTRVTKITPLSTKQRYKMRGAEDINWFCGQCYKKGKFKAGEQFTHLCAQE